MIASRSASGLGANSLVTMAVLGVSLSYGVAAQADYPQRPIEVTVSFAAGGTSDLAIRSFAASAEKYIDGDFVVQNRPGAGGVVGTEHVYRADPDGYHLLLGRIGPLAVGPALEDVPYDPADFTYVGIMSTDPYLCSTGADQPYQDLDDLAAAIAEQPGVVTYGSAGVGTLTQFAVLRLLEELDIGDPATVAVHVPYSGDGTALPALVGGHISLYCGPPGTMIDQIRAGQLRGLVVTSTERLDELPDVPTASEAGYPGLEDVAGWSALVGPPDMDPDALAVLEDVMAQVSEDEEWRRSVRELGAVPDIRPSEESRQFVINQQQTFVELVERLGLRD